MLRIIINDSMWNVFPEVKWSTATVLIHPEVQYGRLLPEAYQRAQFNASRIIETALNAPVVVITSSQVIFNEVRLAIRRGQINHTHVLGEYHYQVPEITDSLTPELASRMAMVTFNEHGVYECPVDLFQRGYSDQLVELMSRPRKS